MNTNSDKIDFSRTIYEIRKHWRYFLISFIVVMGIAVFYWQKKSKVYAFHAEMLIEQTEGPAAGGMMAMMKSFSMGSLGGGSVDDELVVLKSRSLLNQLIAELDLNYNYIDKSSFRDKNLYRETPVKISADRASLDKMLDGFTVKLTLHPDGTVDATVKDGIFSTAFEGKNLQLPVDFKYGDNSFRLEKTPFFKKIKGNFDMEIEVEGTQKTAETMEKVADDYVESLKTNVILLNYEDDNIARGHDILNTKLRIFNERRLEEEKQKANREISFIDDRLQTLIGQLADSEKKLEEFKTVNDVTDLKTEAKVLLEQTSANKASIVGLQTQLAIFDMICEFLDNPENRYSMIPVTSGQDYESAAKSIESYNQLILERMKLDMSAKRDNKALLSLNKQIDAMREGVVETMRKARESAEIAYNDFVREDGKYAVRLRKLPAHERQYLNLFRDQQIKNDLYVFLLEQRESNALKFGASPIGRIVDPAYNDVKKIAPKGSVILGLGFIISILIPLLILMIKAIRMKRIAISNDIENLSGMPVVLETGLEEPAQATAFKHLRSRLTTNKEIKTITFATQSEHYDTAETVAEVARLVSETARKVAVVEAEDINLSKQLKANSSHSLSDYLCGKTSLEEISAGNRQEINLIPAGNNEPGLLLSDSFAKLIDRLKGTHDFVIICGRTFDSFSLLPAVASQSDRILATVESGVKKTDFKKFDQALKELDKPTGYILAKR